MSDDSTNTVRRYIDVISRSADQLALILHDPKLQRPTLQVAMGRELDEIAGRVHSIRARLAEDEDGKATP